MNFQGTLLGRLAGFGHLREWTGSCPEATGLEMQGADQQHLKRISKGSSVLRGGLGTTSIHLGETLGPPLSEEGGPRPVPREWPETVRRWIFLLTYDQRFAGSPSPVPDTRNLRSRGPGAGLPPQAPGRGLPASASSGGPQASLLSPPPSPHGFSSSAIQSPSAWVCYASPG